MKILKSPAARGVALLILLSAIPVGAALYRIGWFVTGAAPNPEIQRFVDAPLPVMLHVVGAVLFAPLGAAQFLPRLRRHAWHRRAGRAVWLAGVAIALSGLWMTLSYEFPTVDRTLALYWGRLVTSAWMAIALVIGLWAALGRKMAAHRAYMIRGYAIGMGAGSQAIIAIAMGALGFDETPEYKAFYMWAGWIVNALAAEWIIHRPWFTRRAPAPTTSPVP